MMQQSSHQENSGKASKSALLLTISLFSHVGSSINKELVAGTKRCNLFNGTVCTFAFYSCLVQAARTSSTSQKQSARM